jgi:hypothetical protein
LSIQVSEGEIVGRFRSVAIAALALSALTFTSSAAYAHGPHNQNLTTSDSSDEFTMHWAYYRGELTDLRPETTEPLDGATASAVMVGINSSRFTLRVRGIDGSAGRTFGAHLHLGPCVEGDWAGVTGLAHYNTDVLAQVIPPDISKQTEVWLDFKANSAGQATVRVSVPFIPEPGERSIVINAEPTNPETGVAGPRLACLPLDIKQLG